MPQLTEQQFNDLCDKHDIDTGEAFHNSYIQDCLLMGDDDIIECIEWIFKKEF